MALEHDSKGFLVGDPIDFKESNKLLGEIRDELKSLRSSMVFSGVKIRDPKTVAAASQRAREMPRNNGKFVSQNPPKDTSQSRTASAPIENTQLRDNGRFASQTNSKKSTSGRFISETASRVGGAAATVGGRAYEFAKQTDPVVQALSDVGGPLASGMRTLFSSRYKPADEGVPWYKRIFREVRYMRRENGQFSKAEIKELKKIEDKPNVIGGSSSDSFFGGLTGSVLPALLVAVPTILGAIFSPVTALLATGATAAWGLFADNGKKVFSDIADKMFVAWDGAVKTFSEMWKPVADFFKEKFGVVEKAVVQTAETANNAVKETTGIDLKAGYKKAVDFTSRNIIEPAAKGAEWISNKWDSLKSADMSLSSMIRGGESGKAGYNAYNRGTIGNKILGSTGHRDLENMTIGEIMANQNLPKSDVNRLFAVGKYQMIPDTLKSGVEALGINKDAKFDKAMQERLFSDYLLNAKRPQISKFIKGKGDIKSAQLALSQEWASIADPTTGKSYYDKKGGNSSSISAQKTQAALMAANQQYQANLKAGMGENEAYSMAVRGLGTPSAVSTMKPAIASPGISVANPPSIMRPATVAEAPAVVTPLMSPRQNNMQGNLSQGLVGQDVDNRSIAHICTGGYSRL